VLTAIFLVHLPNGFFAADNGTELPLLLMICCIGLVLAGSGEPAVDQLINGRIPGAATRRRTEPLHG
jgi:putative oxidoreductase